MRALVFTFSTFLFTGLLSFQAQSQGKPRGVPSGVLTGDLFDWGKEVCVIYDYRPLLSAEKSSAPYLFAIERKNANGGIFERTYDLKLRANVKGALAKVMNDVAGLVEKGLCHSVEVYYPTKERMDAPM
jgi:hypothetical protein